MTKGEKTFGNIMVGIIAIVIMLGIFSFVYEIFSGNFSVLVGGARWRNYSEIEY